MEVASINPSMSVSLPTFHLCGPVRLSSDKIWSPSFSGIFKFWNWERQVSARYWSGMLDPSTLVPSEC